MVSVWKGTYVKCLNVYVSVHYIVALTTLQVGFIRQK